jgi:hypothetical protein
MTSDEYDNISNVVRHYLPGFTRIYLDLFPGYKKLGEVASYLWNRHPSYVPTVSRRVELLKTLAADAGRIQRSKLRFGYDAPLN